MKLSLILSCLSLGALSLASCNSPSVPGAGGSVVNSSGEIADGTYTGATEVCDGTLDSTPPPTFVITSGTGGTFSNLTQSGTGGACTLSGNLATTYPGGGTIALTLTLTGCNLAAACGGGPSCPTGSKSVAGTFSGSGSTLTVTLTDSDCNGGSTTEVDTFTN